MSKSYLTDETVIVKFIPDFKNGITDKHHPLYGGLSSNASIAIPAPLLTNELKDIFTKEELEFLAKELNEDSLAPNSSFWREFRKDEYGMPNGVFPIFLKKEGMLLNKKDALHYIYIKILENDPIIANSVQDTKNRAGCRFLLIKHDQMHKEDLSKINSKKEAFKLHTKYEKNDRVLRYVLKSFNKSVAFNTTGDFLIKETWKLAEVASDLFVKTLEDPYLEAKILLDDAIRFKLVSKSNNLFYNLVGDPIALDGEANDYAGASKFLDSGAGQEMKLEIEAKIKVLSK